MDWPTCVRTRIAPVPAFRQLVFHYRGVGYSTADADAYGERFPAYPGIVLLSSSRRWRPNGPRLCKYWWLYKHDIHLYSSDGIPWESRQSFPKSGHTASLSHRWELRWDVHCELLLFWSLDNFNCSKLQPYITKAYFNTANPPVILAGIAIGDGTLTSPIVFAELPVVRWYPHVSFSR